ncbi:MAG: pectate lyase [Planctomycetaceae bacterium]|nr:pectate lyase [Planctomycetaceae bacterium]
MIPNIQATRFYFPPLFYLGVFQVFSKLNLAILIGLNLLPSACLQAADVLLTAETVLVYQRSSGGWPKNYDREERLSESRRKEIQAAKMQRDSTIDNGATHREIRILASAYKQSGNDRYRTAAIRGIRYLIEAQYDNGGWPQYYPLTSSYHLHITYNDGAMIGVMDLFRDIVQRDKEFDFVSGDFRGDCEKALRLGLDCILKTQVRLDGKLTVWCAQHDRESLKPAKARSYELPSLSGHESVGIVKYLMTIDDPSPEIVTAIESAVSWFQENKLTGLKLERFDAPGTPKGTDIRLVKDVDAPPLWGRFYDLKEQQPIFCSRDGIPRRSIEEISYERRNGYSWLGEYARDLLKKHYPAWKKR